MKKLTLLLSALALLATPALRGGDASTYEGTITGVVCVACKQHVTEALTAKLDGFRDLFVRAEATVDRMHAALLKDNA